MRKGGSPAGTRSAVLAARELLWVVTRNGIEGWRAAIVRSLGEDEGWRAALRHSLSHRPGLASAVIACVATVWLSGCAAALLGRASSGTPSSVPAQTSSGSARPSTAGSATGGRTQRPTGTGAATSSAGTQRPSSSGSAVGGSASSGSTGSATSRTGAQIEQDRQIAASVRSRLLSDASTQSLAVSVDVYQGVVSLHGDVSKAEQRSAAERITRGVAGVRQVRNELRLR